MKAWLPSYTFIVGWLALWLWLPVIWLWYDGGEWWEILLGILVLLLPVVARLPVLLGYFYVLPALALIVHLGIWAVPKWRRRFQPHLLTHLAALAILAFPFVVLHSLNVPIATFAANLRSEEAKP